MKILILAQYFPPDITAAAFRIFDTARLLEAGGHEVHVITAYPHRAQVSGESTGEYDLQISHVARTKVISLKGGGFLNYVRHYASFMLGSSWLGFREIRAHGRPDVIWATSPPLFVGLSGVALARLFRVPLVLDVRDIWPASAVGTGQLSASGRAYRWGEKMERFVYDKAVHITCVARPMQEYIRTRTKTPVTVVYNGVRAGDISLRCGEGNGDGNDHTLLYAGNFGRAQQLDLLIRAWASVRARNGYHNWTIKLLGAGALEQDLKDLVARLGVSESVMFMSPVSRSNALREMDRSAAMSVTLRPDKVFERTIPSKVFDCMAVGKPILAGVSGEARSILESTGANVCYEPGSQEGLEQALERLMNDYGALRQKAGGNPQVVRNEYTREKATGVLMEVLNSVVSNGTHRR
ncbi:MAG: glycosyltransferase family 4 protein [Phycisphaerales bacterium]